MKIKYKIACVAATCLALGFMGITLAGNNGELSQRVVRVKPLLYGPVDQLRIMPTHIYFSEELGIGVISDFANSRFLFREASSRTNSWSSTAFSSLNRPHAISYHPPSKLFFAVDTDNHQIVSFNSLTASDANIKRYKEIGGYPVGSRPHDIIYNEADGYLYVIISTGVLRFMPKGDQIEQVTLISKPEIIKAIRKKYLDFALGYVRAISLVDGQLFLANSSYGNVIQIDDFLNPDSWTVHINDNQPNKNSIKGNFDDNGLVLNDLDYYQGFWYASNYYPGNESNFRSTAAVSKNKLIRWKSWDDFKNSNWEDLSHLVHEQSIPYNFTKHDGKLYLAMFHSGKKADVGSGIYEIQTSLF